CVRQYGYYWYFDVW
nr:immunoglobulin heavy chain junction region [Mus musculus]